LGVGPSAHSYNGDTRQWNIASNAKYIASLTDGKIPAEIEILTESNRLNEYIMTSLRTSWGMDLARLNAIAAGAADLLLNAALPFFERDWITQNEQIITLTSSGKLYADHIAAELFF
jgi:oxygen-independent coproporphyrinogen-3 oxidase